MKGYNDATLNSGFAIGLLAGVSYIINGIISSPQNFIIIIILGILVLGFFWVIGIMFSAILLIPLCPIFRNSSRVFSCIIFLFIGTIIPMVLQHKLNQFSGHGIDLYSPENISDSIGKVVFMSSIGFVGAFSAWYTLLKEHHSY